LWTRAGERHGVAGVGDDERVDGGNGAVERALGGDQRRVGRTVSGQLCLSCSSRAITAGSVFCVLWNTVRVLGRVVR
jgi:hypothetical protein